MFGYVSGKCVHIVVDFVVCTYPFGAADCSLQSNECEIFQLAVWSSGMILCRVREVLGAIPRTALAFGSVVDLLHKFSDARFQA